MSGRIYNKNYTFLKDQPFAENLLVYLSYKRSPKVSLRRDSYSLPTQLLKGNIQSIADTPIFGSNQIPNKSEKMKKAESRLAKHFCSILEHQLKMPHSVTYSPQYPAINLGIAGKSKYKYKYKYKGKSKGSSNKKLLFSGEQDYVRCSLNNPPLVGQNSGQLSKSKSMGKSKAELEFENLYTREFLQEKTKRKDLFFSGMNPSLLAFPVEMAIPHLLVSVDSMRNTLAAIRTSRTSERIKTPSQFKRNIRECRKIRLLYGNLPNRQLCRGTTKMRFPGENILLWLESRLDVVLERCGFFVTIKSARQSVLNRKITVNSKVVTIPGFLLKGGDIIKVVQERLPLHSLNKELSRGTILSNTVFPQLVREKVLAVTLSKSIPGFNITRQQDLILAGNNGTKKTSGLYKLSHDLPVDSSTRFNTDSALEAAILSKSKIKVNKRESTSPTASSTFKPSSSPGSIYPAFRDLSVYSSFFAWLTNKGEKALYQKNYGVTQSSVPYTARVPIKASSSINWRFVGSPHLMLSLFLFNYQLERSLCFVQQALIKGTLVNEEVCDHKACNILTKRSFVWRKRTSRSIYISTRQRSDSRKIENYKGDLEVPTISSTSKYYATNTVSIETQLRDNDNIRRGPYSAMISCSPFLSKSKSKDQLLSNAEQVTLNSPTIDLFLNTVRQILQRNNVTSVNNRTRLKSPPSQIETVPSLYRSLLESEGLLLEEKERYVNVFKEVYNNLFTYIWFSRCNQHDNIKEDIDSSLVASLLIKLYRKNRVDVLFSDLSLYSLFIRREVLCARQEKELQAKSRAPAYYKKTNINKSKGVSQRSGRKPLHLEVSYQSLCAVYLYPPQRVCLPVMIDIDCLAKVFLKT